MQRIPLLVLVVALALAGLWWALAGERASGPASEEAATRLPGEASPGPTLRAAASERRDPSALATSPAPAAGAPRDELVLVGRVVDTSRRGVAGATVLLLRHGGSEVRTTTDGTGAYRLGMGQPLEPWSARGWWRHALHVRAYDAHGRADQRLVPAPQAGAREVQVPWHVLKPAGSLRVRVMGPAGPLERAEVRVSNVTTFQPNLAAAGTTDARGLFDPGPLPPATYRLVAFAAGLGRGVASVSLAALDEREVELSLALPRSLDVRVLSGGGDVRSGATDRPLAGATVEVLERVKAGRSVWAVACEGIPPPPPTDADGRTRIEGVGPGPISLVVEALGHEAAEVGADLPAQQRAKEVQLDGGAPTREQQRGGIGPGVKEVTFVLRPLVRLRWPIKAGEVPTPPEGTVLALQGDPGAIDAVLPPTARVEGGFIVGEGWSDGIVHAIAIAPDGTYAALFRLPDQADGIEAVFQRPRRLTARVTTSDGKPAAGYFASVRNQGNVTMVKPTLLDQDGSVTWTLYHPYLVEVYVGPTAELYSGWTVGSADLKAGDGRVEGVVPVLRDITLKVRVDGKPGLPAEPVLTAPNGGFLGAIQVLSEDPEAGVLHARCAVPDLPAPGEPLLLFLAAPGFLQAQAQIESVTGPQGAGGIVARVDLVRAGSLKIRVLVRPGAGSERLDLQRLHPAPRGWQSSHAQGTFSRPLSADFTAGAGEALVFVPDQPAGAYRVLAPACLGLSPVVQVRPGEENEVVLDLRAAGLVKGRIEAPEGVPLESTEITLDARDVPEDPFVKRRAQVRSDGSFELRVPGDRPLPLLVRHPYLRLDPAQGTLQVEAPREGLVIRLVTASALAWTHSGGVPPAPPAPPGMPDTGPRVLLFDDAEGHDLATAIIRHEARARREGERFIVGGLAPGRFTVWIDAPWCAPIVRRGVVVGEGEVDLGALEAQAGTTVRVRFRVKPGAAVPRVNVWAQHEAAPTYMRSASSQGGAADLLLPGLGPGRFRIQVAPMMGGGPYALTRTLDLPGTGEVVLEVGPE